MQHRASLIEAVKEAVIPSCVSLLSWVVLDDLASEIPLDVVFDYQRK